MENNIKLSEEVLSAFYKAQNMANNNHHDLMTPEHYLLALVDGDFLRTIFLEKNISTVSFVLEVEDFIRHTLPSFEKEPPLVISVGYHELHKLAMEIAQQEAPLSGTCIVDVIHFLKAMLNQVDSFAAYFLYRHGITEEWLSSSHFIDNIIEESRQEEHRDFDEDEEALIDFLESVSEEKLLKQSTEDLTELAEKNRLSPFVGRRDLMETVEQILLRHRKSNPLLLGDPGVGKTALIEGLAQRIVNRQVPEGLAHCRILSLDVGAVVAGTRYRGDFELKMKKILKALEKDPSVILFIDEIHTVIGAGSGSSGSIDVSNMLKTSLAGGAFTCIGATTYDEFKKKIEPEKAFLRRFQVVDVSEPTAEEVKEIVCGAKKELERHHGVRISTKTALRAIELSQRYIKDRQQPDKAIDLLDEVCSSMRINKGQEAGSLTMGEKEITQFLAHRFNIPQEYISESQEIRLQDLENRLKSVIFGQDEAIKTLCEAIKGSYAGFRKENLPIASLLFIGPTGVGKTELCRQLAELLGAKLLRYDMSEYQEKMAATRLIGAPPGFVGHQEGGVLIEEIRKNPNAVLLLDEIEKAHSDIFNLLLQVMDNALLTDSLGRKADFSRVILIMTGNVGASEWERGSIGFNSLESANVTESLKNTFTPEFRNRLDGVVNFKPLSKEDIRRVIEKEVALFGQQLKKRGISLSLSKAAVEFLANKGFSREMGARPAARKVDQELKKLFLDEVLFGTLKNGGRARVDCQGEGLVLIKGQPQKVARHSLKEVQKRGKGRKSEEII